MLSEIKELADTRGSVLTLGEVNEFFQNAHLEEEQLLLICEYLLSQKIQVEGYESRAEKARIIQPEEIPDKTLEKETERDLEGEDFVQMYLEDLEAVQIVSEEEELELFCQAAGGDELARARLVEQKLGMVYELSVTYCGLELPQCDLIQEGNVALLMAVNQLPKKGALEEYRGYLFGEIQEAMEAALEEYRDLRDMDEEIAERANHLREAVKNLEEDLEHKVTMEELSAYLEMPAEEIKDILRMAGEEIEIEDRNKKEDVSLD